MKGELTRLPFDHFQRYGTAAALIGQLNTKRLRILEVGANRQRLLSQAFPDADIVFTDVTACGDDADLVLASAAALPFGDATFDVVVCLDVLEHIPADLRRDAVKEMARVAARLLIIGCPVEAPWVKDAESEANACWSELFEGGYPWLAEHQEFGLVDADAVDAVLKTQMPSLRRVSQGAPEIWSALMAAHFMKERVPSLGPLVASLDYLYNTAAFDGDFPARGYREYFIGVRHEADAARVSEWLARPTEIDGRVTDFLRTIPSLIRPVVDGIVRTEAAWASTVGMYQDQLRDLEATKQEWGNTADALVRAREDAVRLGRDLAAAQAGWDETLAALVFLREREAALTRDLNVAKAGWEEAVATLEESRQQESIASRDLGIARAGWEEAVSTLAQVRERELVLDRDLGIARAGWEQAVSTLAQVRERELVLDRDLGIARAGWEESVAALRATQADLLRTRDDVDYLRADLDTAKREWSATAQLLATFQAEARAHISGLEVELEQTDTRRRHAERMAYAADVGRRRAMRALAIVAVFSIVAIIAILLS
ncbi:methyltransferase domain-containing protein [Luteimonas aestuarii]|uniref:Methyltransferase domain-containing protein n=1 Tax=Luteimonas aestuarii TaxID=453837 RepID=A0A4R5TQ15_9GAMM|nr:class I SAM-dependent methyltransferase [Luteimonas aestuarii]TDK24279.1 methyltransferase domain-containing protein [Luteimonas aestuarii]